MVHHGSGVPHLPVLLLLLLLLVTVRCAKSQSTAFPPSSNGSSAGFSATTAVIFVSLLIVFFLLAFFSVYLHRCTDSYISSGFSASTATATASGGVAAGRERRRGLDPAVVDSFPTMQYAAAKELKGEKGEALECAVCLSEFADDDTLRLLPGCCHVFHPDCIDGWLASHVTCPVCRANLSDPAVLNVGRQIASEDTAEEAAIGGLESDPGPMVPATMELGFRRSQSAVDGVDRFTLRLPGHVRKEMEEVGRLRRVASLAGYHLERRGGGGGEGGARRWRSFLRTISIGRIRGEEGSEGSDKRVFPLNGAPVVGDSSGSASGEKEVSEMAVLNRV